MNAKPNYSSRGESGGNSQISLENDSNTHEIKSQENALRKKDVVPTNVVDTKITLFTAPSASASTSGHQRVATYQQRPKIKDYNQVRGVRTTSKH